MKKVGSTKLLQLLLSFLAPVLVSGVVAQLAYADDAENSGTSVSISMINADLPASDIVYPQVAQSQVLPPECKLSTTLPPDCAQLLKQSGVDLSLLDPDASTDVWKGPSSAADESLDQALGLSDNDETTFVGVIESSSGRFRFNVRVDTGAQPAQTMTLMVGTTLHTFLMRKELLRRLGYVIPPMKYLHQVKIKFDTLKLRDDFLQNQFQQAVGGPSISRWIPELAVNAKTQALELTFQDVMVMQATPIIYNLGIGIPIQQVPGSTNLRAEGTRILRAVSIPAGLTDVPESINIFDWTMGQIQNQAMTFHTNDQTNYGCTEDDALWILRRLAKLTRQDFVDIVAHSYYPDAIAKVLVEKLISRRNTILSNFKLSGAALPYDKSPTELPGLKSGKIVQADWQGFGSFFSGKDPPSPLHGLQWYIVSETASNVMSTLLEKVNNELPGLLTQNQITKHETELQNKFMSYLEGTGPMPSMNIGAWVLPIANGTVNISRDVVLGNYMGTNNSVQLADSFGFTANVGLYAGVDNAPSFLSLSGLVEATAQITFSHVKPINLLKQGITEPLKEEFVPWLMAHGAGILNAAAAVKNEPTNTADQIKKSQTDLKNDLDKIDDFLAPGDSLIVTESINGLEQASANLEAANVFSQPAISSSIQSNQEVIWRLNFFRSQDGHTIQIFKDDGQLVNVIVQLEGGISKASTNGQASPVFPVVSFMGKKVAGKAKSEIFTVDIGLNQGSRIYTVINALDSALTRGSVEQLEALQKPNKPLRLEVGFKDSSSQFQFFHLIHRTLKSDGQIHIELPDGTKGDYLYIQDGKQSGKSYQNLVTQAATYIAQLVSGDTTVAINTQTPQNPGQSFLGSSHTRNTSFEARIINKGITQPSVQVQYRWEGFNISQSNMVELAGQLSQQYGFKLFNDGFLNDTKDIKMYALDLNVNLYEKALSLILNMSDADQKALDKKYGALHQCDNYPDNLDQMSGQDEDACAAMERFDSALHDYKRGKFKNASEQGKAGMTVASDLEQYVTFTDLVNIVGGPLNIYMNAQITGYRDGSEESSSNPISSNNFGTADPVGGIVDAVESEKNVNLQNGEFDVQWMRDIL
jgi:hypothetical protein